MTELTMLTILAVLIYALAIFGFWIIMRTETMTEIEHIVPGDIWLHADGGRYIILSTVVMHVQKGDNWSWRRGVRYQLIADAAANEYVRTLEDFLSRFTKA